MENILNLWTGSGVYNITGGQITMILVCLFLLYLAIKKGFEPLLLVPIGFGGVLANIPEAGLALTAAENAIHFHKPEVMVALAEVLKIPFEVGQDITAETLKAFKTAYAEGNASTVFAADQVAKNAGYANGMLANFYSVIIGSTVGPLLIFMGVGAMTDFGPLLANPRTILLGAAAQFGIFGTVLGAALLTTSGIMEFSIYEAAAIGIIGGADGPTSIYVASVLSPHLLGAIAVAAYSYMALVPVLQPPIMNALTTAEERKIQMVQLRPVNQLEKILFPIAVLILVALFLPDAAPLLGMFCLGNLMKECGVVDRLSDTAQNALINVVTIFLGLSVGSKLSADKFLDLQTLGILILGMVAFGVGTGTGVLMAKAMNVFSTNKINPLIGSAGVSAVPMAARVSNKVGLDNNPQNFLLMHAMGPNVAGVIGSAVAAGVMIKFLGG
ncbi:oxaloacetate decarboxylase subunit beta [Oleiphilus sp. HI0071]|jgi:oxaloacetate decarboxylase beta subunit|uniref:sodium ion-translocating decarboxylase subunit beta n=1 Tax=unclassified Oleiphilus TaxID=2631174 RepID=UPI0007C2F77F|nr:MULTISPECIES: sodium ion-translocating decarboxylase subunit beta [unclassified Oleiphilus]KZY70169.1 oxaloacetate decarboxylase subunit beta [Oleiphilus sp. HI0065]KZY83363.1 oxaloacetate decarboxylase subunit beta [Oleiphilus sp. HI0071]KZY91033.1 oxaloacetate decarboxylase subunit beta [Oleiphilus sp. HI0073]KZZ42055.1 oxaloacetate decarboxylase subunit beta [Oleiphilus sp. HI0118]KZZ60496.1 oxaloacetate decarboxylase subunit beta [Oleiphilus sp. HI0122]KZZ72558.1 oxaloacetate decarboxy